MSDHGRATQGGGDPGSTGDLREIVRYRLLHDVLGNSAEKHPGWMVLVVDRPALRVISSPVGMYDLMEHRITLVEDLTKKRSPFRDMGVVYLLAPTPDSVKRLIEDWTPGTNRKEPMYGNSIFLYFLNRIPDPLLNKIKGCKALVRRIRALGEVNIDFLARESRAFHLDMRNALRYVFPRRPSPGRCEQVMADKIVSLCVTLNEYPHIRYRASSPLVDGLAKLCHRKMSEYVGANEKWWYHGDPTHPSRGRSTLLLFDRSDDCLSPMMHEFTYQAMVHDLLDVKDGERVTYKSETISGGGGDDEGDAEGKTADKDVLLNDNDSLWLELRGKHIAEVIEMLSGRIRGMLNSNTAAVSKKSTGGAAKAMSLTQMAAALKEMPEYRQVMEKLTQHMTLSHQCMEIFNREELLDLSELEQTLATGKDDSGRVPKLNELVERVEECMKGSNNSLIRLRLLAILIVSQNGMRDEDKDRLLAAARLAPRELRVLNNLEHMGVPVLQKDDDDGGNRKLSKLFKGGKRAVQSAVAVSDSEYTSSRYVPPLKSTLEEWCRNSLSLEEYPSVLPMPEEGASSGLAVSARNRDVAGATSARGRNAGKSKWSKPSASSGGGGAAMGAGQALSFGGERCIAFVVGGACYSELRAAREVMAAEGREIVMGSTRFVSPKDFVVDLNSLEGAPLGGSTEMK